MRRPLGALTALPNMANREFASGVSGLMALIAPLRVACFFMALLGNGCNGHRENIGWCVRPDVKPPFCVGWLHQLAVVLMNHGGAVAALASHAASVASLCEAVRGVRVPQSVALPLNRLLCLDARALDR